MLRSNSVAAQQFCAVLVGAAWVACAGPAAAQNSAQPAYVGTWARSPSLCKKDQSTEAAPLVLKASRLDQYETHCNFVSVKGNGSSWQALAKCTVQGDEQRRRLRMSVSGTTLTYRWTLLGKSQTLVRC